MNFLGLSDEIRKFEIFLLLLELLFLFHSSFLSFFLESEILGLVENDWDFDFNVRADDLGILYFFRTFFISIFIAIFVSVSIKVISAVFLVVMELRLIFFEEDSSGGIVKFLQFSKFFRSAYTASEREHTAFGRVSARGWVSNAKWAINSIAIVKLHAFIVTVVIVTSLTEIMSSEAAK